MILYHAISTFQLLECIVHHLRYTADKQAILVLPDFIVNKFPHYKKLQKMKDINFLYYQVIVLILHKKIHLIIGVIYMV